MEPMKPMAPMKPFERWWPDHFGEPASAGSQNGLRYAFFRSKHRLAVDRGGVVTVYDAADHDISGVSQASGNLPSVEFTSQLGTVKLGDLAIAS